MEPESNHIAYEINQPLEDFKNILNSSNFQSLIFFLKIKSVRQTFLKRGISEKYQSL
jgi:hypothetical protein